MPPMSDVAEGGRGDGALGGDHQGELVLRHVGGEKIGVFFRLDEDIRAGCSVGQGEWDQIGGTCEVTAGKPSRQSFVDFLSRA